jgi:NitT/TauT family transport system substrate-binding protein
VVTLLVGCGGEAAQPTAPAATPTTPAAVTEPTSTTAAPAEPTATTAAAQPTPPATKQDVKLILNFLAGGPQAGFMYAKKLGYYDEVGINLTIEEGKGSATTAQQIAAGQADFGISDAPSTMAVRAKGGPVKVVAPILQTNGFALISLKDKNITKVADLEGKNLAVQPGTAQTALLDAVFLANNVDKAKVNIVNIDPAALVSTLIEGKVDAILAGADFQSVQIRDRGYEVNDIFYRDAGVPTVGLSIITRDEVLQNNPDLVKRFVSASLKGWDAARKDPDAASAAVVEQFVSGNKEQILKQLNVDLKLICSEGAKSLGAPSEETWNKTYDLLTKYQGLPTDKPVTDYYTAEFVPADAPTCP